MHITDFKHYPDNAYIIRGIINLMPNLINSIAEESLTFSAVYDKHTHRTHYLSVSITPDFTGDPSNILYREIAILADDSHSESIIERYNSIVEEINSKGTGLELYTDGERR